MRDLSPVRSEREIWITRGHLYALAVLTVFIAVLAFFVGLLFGKIDVQEAEPSASQQLIPPDLEADALDELLARLEEASLKEGDALSTPVSVREEPLTFPSVLQGEEQPREPAHEPIEVAHVEAGRRQPAVPAKGRGGAVPKKGWAVQIASLTSQDEAEASLLELESAGYDGYWIAAVVDGVTRYRVRVGYSKKEEALAGRDELSRELGLVGAFVQKAP